jgi:hypothetical protein
MAINIRVLYKAVNVMIYLTTNSFSGRTLLHGFIVLILQLATVVGFEVITAVVM